MSYAPATQASGSMVVQVDNDGAAISVAPVGPNLGQREAQPILNEAVAALRDRSRGTRFFVLDLSAINTMTAYGLGLCSDLAKRARDVGLEPILFGATGEILDGLRLFKTDRLFKVVRSRDQLVVMVHG